MESSALRPPRTARGHLVPVAAGHQRQRSDGRTSERLLEILRERIASHTIPPGAKLRENDLAQEFDVSRARIREVFGALESRGLIQRIPNRGAIVARLELAQVFEIYDVREALDGLAVRLAVQNTPPEHWDDLVHRFAQPIEHELREGRVEAYEQAYAEFRHRVIEAAQNPVLKGMLDSIFEKTQVIMRRVLILPGRAEKGLNEQRAVLAAMRRADAAEAERLKRANIRSAIEDLRRYQRYVL